MMKPHELKGHATRFRVKAKIMGLDEATFTPDGSRVHDEAKTWADY